MSSEEEKKKKKKGKKNIVLTLFFRYDTDNPDHMNWLYERALSRAQEFNIEGVTLKKTQVSKKLVIYGSFFKKYVLRE